METLYLLSTNLFEVSTSSSQKYHAAVLAYILYLRHTRNCHTQMLIVLRARAVLSFLNVFGKERDICRNLRTEIQT